MNGPVSRRDPQRADIERCHQEIAALEAEVRGGNPDLEGLCLALRDWSGELRLLQGPAITRGAQDAEDSAEDREAAKGIRPVKSGASLRAPNHIR